jgi:tetratricopeptide (TPR) repeat protein
VRRSNIRIATVVLAQASLYLIFAAQSAVGLDDSVADLHSQAVCALSKGNIDDAETVLQRAVARSKLGEKPAELGTSYYLLAVVSIKKEDYLNAERQLGNAVAEHNKVNHGRNSDAVADFACLAGVEEAQGKLKRAERSYQAGIALNAKLQAKEQYRGLPLMERLGDLHKEQAEFARAEIEYKRYIEFEKADDNHLSYKLLDVAGKLAGVLRKQAKYAEAEALIGQTRAAFYEFQNQSRVEQFSDVQLARVYAGMKKFDEAEVCFARAVRNAEREKDSTAGTILLEQADFYRDNGMYLKAACKYFDACRWHITQIIWPYPLVAH